MGADLYINSIFKPNNDKYKAEFDAAVKARNDFDKSWETAFKPQPKQSKALQAEVTRLYDQLYAVGYFRDSYNDSDLLWQLDLNWWTDVGNMLDDDGMLSVENTKVLLAMVQSRKLKTRKVYFKEKKARFEEFLQTAIALNEPIECSI